MNRQGCFALWLRGGSIFSFGVHPQAIENVGSRNSPLRSVVACLLSDVAFCVVAVAGAIPATIIAAAAAAAMM